MKLYEIEITVRAVVQAEDMNDAYSAAYNDRKDIVSEMTSNCISVVTELPKDSPLPDGWDKGCYPYGQGWGITEKRIEQIWEAQPEPEEYNPWTDDQIYENL